MEWSIKLDNKGEAKRVNKSQNLATNSLEISTLVTTECWVWSVHKFISNSQAKSKNMFWGSVSSDTILYILGYPCKF